MHPALVQGAVEQRYEELRKARREWRHQGLFVPAEPRLKVMWTAVSRHLERAAAAQRTLGSRPRRV